MSLPAVILPAIQRGDMDCGLCCLQMLADRPYEIVRDEAVRVVPKLHSRGMFASELRRIGRTVGLSLVRRPDWTDDDVGVLDVRLPRGGRHFAVLFRGVLLNPSDGMVWEPATYLSTKKGRVRALYAVEGGE